MKGNLKPIVDAANQIILGKQQQIRLSLCCLLARGHLLIEDLPGVGKTTLAHLLGRLLGLDYQRIQFTSDLLPADILGVSVYDRNAESFQFHPGPVFSQLVLADEINRATPKTQSALLEAMEEQQVTADGQTHPLPQPFFVIATQNPAHQVGTFPLPESQLDRFLMRIEMGYPARGAERELLAGQERRSLIQRLEPIIDPQQLADQQQLVDKVHVSEALLDYVQALLDFSREHSGYRHGLSPRAGLALVRAARAWALLDDRYQAIPEDVQAVLPAVAGHRLVSLEQQTAAELGRQLIEQVAIP